VTISLSRIQILTVVYIVFINCILRIMIKYIFKLHIDLTLKGSLDTTMQATRERGSIAPTHS
jgi:hypothetical protein